MVARKFILNMEKTFFEKNNYVFATKITISSFLSSTIAYYLFYGNMGIITWAFIFGTFLPFYCFGTTKKEQVKHLFISSASTYTFILLAAVISMIHNPVIQEFLRFVLVFSCLISQRYLNGGRVLAIFKIVYILLFFYIHPLTTHGDILLAILYPTYGIVIGLIITTMVSLLLPKIEVIFMEVNKDIYVLKKSFYLAILIAAVYVISRFFNYQIQHGSVTQ